MPRPMEMPRDAEVIDLLKKASDEGAASHAITEMVVLHRMVSWKVLSLTIV